MMRTACNGNMLDTGDLSKTISLRLSKSSWSGLQNRTEFGKTMDVINSEKCGCEEWRVKNSYQEKNVESRNFVFRNHWNKFFN